ncbi:MAG TPA: YvcK family protein [Bacillota bacterium]|nr:YvcK family protein [Candidatus Fermentithermobacillaceae bacterium]HOA70307.1 YvcK family protein [Bacillota bacterium]HPT35379.1 YvcK family protein [Bacillota bacterium]HPZ84793.1 YvcK family protein [Bacillota bacterium]HQD85349.1 YvcK family protein [Bacillota bacterium]
MNQPCPKLVVIGGGTGLATVLRGLKAFDCNITAIVTVADDGGSSGLLRKDMGILPPGDIRNCLLALAEAEPEMTALFNHRFSKGKLKGHCFGNLFLAAMTEMTGDFQEAIRAMSRILAVKGKVLPATLSDVSLVAEMDDGSVVFGETAIPLAKGKIKQLRLQPEDPPALDDAVDEIRAADGIIIGPGSLFTSIIPNLLVRGIRQAVAEAAGCKLYICNVMTQPGETDGFDVLDHIQAIQDHAGPLFSHVLVNTAGAPQDVLEKYAEEGKYQVAADLEQLKQAGYQVISGDFLARGDLARHDSFKVATTIMEFVGSRLRKPGAAT